jgi:hypothetical protein
MSLLPGTRPGRGGLQLQLLFVCYSCLVLKYMMTNKPGAGRVTWVTLSNCHAGNIGPGHMGQIVIQSHIGQIVIFFLLPAFFFF